ncbi:MAG: MFS transporter [Rhodospirillales bacterium]|nr:MFS transporter [Rhodospirillales bacterium]
MSAQSPDTQSSRMIIIVLFAGALSVLLAMGLRNSLGLFLKPMTMDLGWGRETFSLALAVQNLLWGAFQPFASAAADKWGPGRIIALGGILYAGGLVIMANSLTPGAFYISAGLMLGMAQSASALGIILGVVGRVMPPEKRSWGLGIVTAAGGVGQFSVVPLGQVLIGAYGWSLAFLYLAAFGFVIVCCAIMIGQSAKIAPVASTSVESAGNLKDAIREAAGHRGYLLLTTGFFVCGFHVAFIAVHLPAYLSDLGMPEETGALALTLIGVFNVIGSYSAGVLGGKWRKKNLLSWLYISRALVFIWFILTPVSTTTVIVFASLLGLLWLSTVPLTSGLVAQIFGTRYMGTLFAFVFFSHQIGSFLGVWLGGYLFDLYGTYMPIWWAGVALGFAAALLHWPINDKTVVRIQPAQ